MLSLYVCSTETAAGKTAVSVGLLRRVARDIGPTGFFKPIGGSSRKVEDDVVDEDVIFLKEALGLTEPLAILSPVVFPPDTDPKKPGALQPEAAERIKDSLGVVARGKEVVVVEGAPTLQDGAALGLAAGKVVEMLGARALLVARYRGEATLDDARAAAELLGISLIGTVVNAVPEEHAEYVSNRLARQMEEAGVSVIGVIPQDRGLMGATVAELADYLGGKVLCCDGSTDRSVESLMIGARSFNTGIPYFQRKQNKAVVTSADRPDMQMAALETSTSCLVVTGDADPDALVLGQAQAIKVPVVRVKENTVDTMERLEGFLAGVRFRQPNKVAIADRLLGQGVDFERLYQTLGLRSRVV